MATCDAQRTLEILIPSRRPLQLAAGRLRQGAGLDEQYLRYSESEIVLNRARDVSHDLLGGSASMLGGDHNPFAKVANEVIC